jgi:hypothetical protein
VIPAQSKGATPARSSLSKYDTPSFITNDLCAVTALCDGYLISFIIIVSTRHSFSTILFHVIVAGFTLPATVNHYANTSSITNLEISLHGCQLLSPFQLFHGPEPSDK